MTLKVYQQSLQIRKKVRGWKKNIFCHRVKLENDPQKKIIFFGKETNEDFFFVRQPHQKKSRKNRDFQQNDPVCQSGAIANVFSVLVSPKVL